MVLLDPGLNGTPGLSSVDLPTLARNAINARCLQLEVILHGQRKLATFLCRRTRVLVLYFLVVWLKVGPTRGRRPSMLDPH
jgi:hypothetical protein